MGCYREAISSNKKILVLINPPYAEAASSESTSASEKTKDGVSKTKVSSTIMRDYGWANRELFVQFIVRISKEMPSATLAMFSKLKYVNAPNFEIFREEWNAKYIDGFIVHSKAFEGLKGNFPIGFLIWKIQQNATKQFPINQISVEVLNKNAMPIGEKQVYCFPADKLLGNWLKRPKANKIEVIPLKNAIRPATTSKDLRGTKWSDNAIGCMFCQGSDMQHVNATALLSSGFSSAGSFFVNPDNLWQAAVIFAVRKLIKPTWVNDRDQLLQPTNELPEEFINDCLIWMLFNGSNLSASADDLVWNDKKWSIVNHFIPFNENEVNSSGRFESDFMAQYIAKRKFSEESKAVLEEGRKIWKIFFEHTDSKSVRDELKLNRPDVGWYQIRKTIEIRNESGDYPPVSFVHFKDAYSNLTNKLQPQVYEFGFLV